MTKESLVIKVESELKDFLQGVADSKNMSLSAYCRYVLGKGLDSIHKRNLEIKRLEKELNIK